MYYLSRIFLAMQLISDQKKMRQDTCFYEDDGTNTNIRVFISVLKFHEAHGDFLLKNEKTTNMEDSIMVQRSFLLA